MRPNKAKSLENCVVIDTELTGLDIENGDRIIALGLVKIYNNVITREQEFFFNPEGRTSDPESFSVHKIPPEKLESSPLFSECAREIIDFIGDDMIVHHCWYREEDDTSTDERALNSELERTNLPIFPHNKYLNIKKWAQVISPEKNSLNDMLDMFGINRTSRENGHGALDDAQLTAKYFFKIQSHHLKQRRYSPEKPTPPQQNKL